MSYYSSFLSLERGPGLGSLPMKYADYLRSPEWRAKRLWALQQAGNACQLCASTERLEVHHRSYERLGAEIPGDLTVLCETCHERHHGILPPEPQPKASYSDVLARIQAADWSSIPSAKQALDDLAPMIARLEERWRDLAVYRICQKTELSYDDVMAEIARHARGVA